MDQISQTPGTRVTIQLYLVSALAVLCMGAVPTKTDPPLIAFALAGAPVLVACALVAFFGERGGRRWLVAASLLVSNLLISVTLGALHHHLGDGYELQMFYFLPLLLTALFHRTGVVVASIALAVIGYPVAVIVGTWSSMTDRTGEIGTALATSVPVGAAVAAVTVLVHRMRQRDLRQRRQLVSQATTDPLTGLMNRRGLRQAIDDGLVHPGACAVVMVDLDHFKDINDTDGHTVGDRVLRETAAVLTAQLGDDGLVVRFGGEEFLLLIRSAGPTDVRAIVERTADELRRIDAASMPVTASYGVTDWELAEPFSDAIRRADEAVYDAKRAGRDRICVRFDDQEEPVPLVATVGG